LSERILIVRLSALGDTALTLPLLVALRERLPRVTIGWVVGEGASPLLRGLAGLDRVHVWPNSDRSFSGLRRLAREIRGFGYDVSLDAQSLTKSAAIPFLARIPRRVGFARYPMGGRELAPLLDNVLVRPPEDMKHISSQALHLGTALDLEMPREAAVALPVDAASLERMRAWWKGKRLTDRTIVFGMGAGWPTKVLPPETVAPLALAAREKGWRCVLVWGPRERNCLGRWQEEFRENAILAPETTVPEMVALLSLAGRYAGADSAGLHSSALLGRPTFSWFGASDPDRCAPRGDVHRYVAKDLPCRPCWKRKCDTPTCVRELGADEILPAFLEWLGT
jgi:ADP-heptose:LPS heptosyltransferase